ncbi:MAG: MarC family protein, partial [Tangfeifania sp.]
SLFICLVFFLSGDFIFRRVFQIEFESFRIFGGIIIFSYAHFFIVKGQRALIMIKENLDDLASEIALPFMVGAGTISLSILLS